MTISSHLNSTNTADVIVNHTTTPSANIIKQGNQHLSRADIAKQAQEKKRLAQINKLALVNNTDIPAPSSIAAPLPSTPAPMNIAAPLPSTPAPMNIAAPLPSTPAPMNIAAPLP